MALRLAITWTSEDLLSIGPLETKCNEILLKNEDFQPRKCWFQNFAWKIVAIWFRSQYDQSIFFRSFSCNVNHGLISYHTRVFGVWGNIYVSLEPSRINISIIVDVIETLWIHLTIISRKISIISRTESPNLNVPRLVLQLSLPNPMKPGVKSWMKM